MNEWIIINIIIWKSTFMPATESSMFYVYCVCINSHRPQFGSSLCPQRIFVRHGDWSERSKQHLYVFVIISKITIISGRHTIDTLFVRLLYSNNNIYHSFFYLHRNHSLAHHTQTNKRKYYVWIETVFRQSYPSFHTPVCVIHHSSFSPSCISSW